MEPIVRQAVVAGQFYEADPDELSAQVGQYSLQGREKSRCLGIVVPHAGLIYSGPVAGSVYSSIELTDSIVLIGPNHTGLGSRASLMTSGSWNIPSATMQIDSVLADSLLKSSPLLTADDQAHRFEHSLEVQLPFIAFSRKTAKIVPLTVMQLSLEECRELGRSIAGTLASAGKEVLIIASSDMSHYISDSLARAKDRIAIDRILALDPEGLYSAVEENGITMCGYIPVIIMLFACLELGARKAELVRYATSAEVSGDYDHVVGYAGMIIKK